MGSRLPVSFPFACFSARTLSGILMGITEISAFGLTTLNDFIGPPLTNSMIVGSSSTVPSTDQAHQLVWSGERSIVPIILAGGTGTRLWPLSREMFPKQFVRFFGAGSASFFESTLKRLHSGFFSPPVIVCNNDYRFLVRQEVERA